MESCCRIKAQPLRLAELFCTKPNCVLYTPKSTLLLPAMVLCFFLSSFICIACHTLQLFFTSRLCSVSPPCAALLFNQLITYLSIYSNNCSPHTGQIALFSFSFSFFSCFSSFSTCTTTFLFYELCLLLVPCLNY